MTQTQPLIEIRPLKPALKANGMQTVTVLIRLHPAAAPQRSGGRLPLNLSLVLDRSGSMSGEPLDMAKQAIVAALRQLRPHDRVSVVSFDDTVQIEVPSTLAHDPAALIARVQGIHSGGSTALHNGWVEGATQVAAHLSQGGLNRVILLSDGQANCGLVDPAEIARHVRGLTARGVSTTTMGFGSHYDENLLLGMATAGDGNFEHIEDARTLPTFFESELQGLTRTSGRTVSLGLEPNPQLRGEVSDVLNDLVRNSFGRYQLGNLVEGQPLSVVARVQVTVPADTTIPLGVTRVRLAWTGLDGVRHSIRAQLDLPVMDAATYDALPDDAEVSEAVSLLTMEQRKQQAIRAMDRGDRASAMDFLTEAVGLAQSMPSPSPEAAASLVESTELQRLYAQGDDRLARKRALSQVYARSQSKPRKE
ncbi:VWA domain-containing protein (plasmid) [Deinococcus sp. KNUC1210]|uniref:vWA domain-containing protein n=1 Tax=Deinococcus sp. KNUC1210 TaxID=2917691 RepID=UPI001EF0957F|nr:VWA domain-containing protein [Deinococcus sp. KNUC1210]ULH17479.1 VWA domain-containing protein [Deinococcus sp. KNUC1210]